MKRFADAAAVAVGVGLRLASLVLDRGAEEAAGVSDLLSLGVEAIFVQPIHGLKVAWVHSIFEVAEIGHLGFPFPLSHSSRHSTPALASSAMSSAR